MEAKTHFTKSEAQHQAMSDAQNALADECEKEGLDGCAKAARACAKVHGERSMHYKAMAGAAAEKAVLDELAKARAELAPTQVRGTIPTNPTVTPVPRYGAKPLATAVDEEFEFLISSGDDR